MLDLAVAALHEPDPDALLPLLSAELLRGCDAEVVIHKGERWTEEAGTIRLWRSDGSVVAVGPGDTSVAGGGDVGRRDAGAAGDLTEAGAADGVAAADADLAGHGGRLLRRGYPFAGHYRVCGDRAPITACQAVGEAVWRRSPTAQFAREALGAEHVLAIPLPRFDAVVSGFLVYRPQHDFPEDRIAYARCIQPLLDGVERQSQVLRSWRAAAGRHHAPGEADECARTFGLTPREVTVLTLLGEALTAEAIGRRLGISVRTVHKHVENLYRKLGTRDRLGTVLRAQRCGLLPQPTTG